MNLDLQKMKLKTLKDQIYSHKSKKNTIFNENLKNKIKTNGHEVTTGRNLKQLFSLNQTVICLCMAHTICFF
jgi:hypothetical protein